MNLAVLNELKPICLFYRFGGRGSSLVVPAFEKVGLPGPALEKALDNLAKSRGLLLPFREVYHQKN